MSQKPSSPVQESSIEPLRGYLQDMSTQLAELARGGGLDQAAAYLTLASLAAGRQNPLIDREELDVVEVRTA